MDKAEGQGEAAPSEKALTPQQRGAARGAAITNSGEHPLAGRISAAEILARYERGERIDAIAAELGCTNKAVYRHLVLNAPEEWQAYQAAHVLDEHQAWNERVYSAPDALELARAREGLKAAQWQLERLCKRLYGTQPEPQERGTIAIQINFASNGAAHSGSAQARPDPDDA